MRQALILAFIGLIAFASASQLQAGVQIAAEDGAIANAYWKCFYEEYVSFAMIQAWNENAPNADFKANMELAKEWGMAPLDAYVTVCESCYFNITEMVATVISMLPEGFNGRLFVQPSTTASQWNTDTKTNLDYLLDVAESFYKANISIGVYTNSQIWSSIFGNNETALHVVPLIIDNSETPRITAETTLSTHTYFGGWTSNQIASSPAQDVCYYDLVVLVMQAESENQENNQNKQNPSSPSSGNKQSPSSGNQSPSGNKQSPSSPSSGKQSPSSGNKSPSGKTGGKTGGKDKSGNQEQSQSPSSDTFGSQGGSEGSDGNNEYSFMDLFSDPYSHY